MIRGNEKMVYDTKKFVEKKLPKAGTKQEGKIIEIVEGKLKDFITIEVLAKWENSTGNESYIQIVMQLDDDTRITKLISLPINGEVHPKSSMGIWKKQFGDYPKVGQEIFALADSEGRYTIPKL